MPLSHRSVTQFSISNERLRVNSEVGSQNPANAPCLPSKLGGLYRHESSYVGSLVLSYLVAHTWAPRSRSFLGRRFTLCLVRLAKQVLYCPSGFAVVSSAGSL